MPSRDPSIAPDPLWTRDYAALCIVNLLTFMAFYSIMPIMPLYLAERLGIFGWEAGLIVGAYAIASIFTRIVCGVLLDNYGRKPIYLFSLVIFALLFFAYLPAASFWFLFILRIVHGLCWGLLIPAGQTAMVDVVPFSRRGEGIGLFGLSIALAMAISPSIGLAVAAYGNYEIMFLVSAGLAIISIAIALKVNYRAAPPTHPPLTLDQMFEPTSFPVGMISFFGLMGYGAVLNWSSVLALTIPDARAGLFFIWLAAGVLISRLTCGRLYDRHGPKLLTSVACGLLMVAFTMLGLTHTPVMYYVAALMTGIGGGIFMPVCLAMVNTMVTAEHRGAANSTYSALFETGIGLGIVLTGTLNPYFGLGGVFLLYGAIAFITGILFLALVMPYFEKHRLNV